MPGRVGTVTVVTRVVEAPAGSVPRATVVSWDVNPLLAAESVTVTEVAGPRPRFVTVSFSGVVPPLFTTGLPRIRALEKMSDLGAAVACADTNIATKTDTIPGRLQTPWRDDIG